MAKAIIHIWHKVPFLRILLSLIAGIIIQWQFQLPLQVLWFTACVFILLQIGWFFIPFFERFRFSFLGGLTICLLFLVVGALLAWYKDIRHDKHWLGNYYKETNKLIVTINEPLIEKTKSYKAEALVQTILEDEKSISVRGKIILYFKKDTALDQIGYGSQILIAKSLQEIQNSGNPGGFDYKRYSLFHDITYQVYLKPGDFILLPGKNEKWIDRFLNNTRQRVLSILKNNIKEEKERGLAEALLIGYKNDLDKNLVQSYTNTGVVHIIAISGLHLGLIYWLMVQLLRPIRKLKQFRWMRPVLIIAVLWVFSLLAGGQPSILRSAVMFTCIVLGDNFLKKGNIFNTLAFSAFILLCWNPFWLWDVGFQLSYAAVLSIIIFMRPIYNWFYFKNKILDFFWKLNAVTLSAQILTLPVSIYHFHQFPDYFLLANFVAVPLSGIILIGEIFLCSISFIPVLAELTGKFLTWLIWLMNSYIEKVDALPYSLLDGLQINLLQATLLTVLAAGISFWLMERSARGLIIGLTALLAFSFFRSLSFINAQKQNKIIVYNVPQRKAIDFIEGRKYYFAGDPDLLADDFARNFHLKPSRVLHRINPADTLMSLFRSGKVITFHSKKILLIDEKVFFQQVSDKPEVDLLVISKNPNIQLALIGQALHIKQVVFDGSVPAWKVQQWKLICDSLQIPSHDVNEKGAFVMNLR